MILSSRAATVVVAAALALLAGCGGGTPKRDPVYPVTGSVQTKGQRAANVRVTFLAIDRQDGPATETEVITDLSGQFKMTTYATGDGLPPGRYAVLMIWPEMLTDDPALGGDRLGGRYNNRQTPAFTIEVKAEPNTLKPFDVK